MPCSRPSWLQLTLASAVVTLLGGCPGCPDDTTSPTQNYTLDWIFVNESQADSIAFKGEDMIAGATVNKIVAKGAATSDQTSGNSDAATTQVEATVLNPAAGLGGISKFDLIPIHVGNTTVVHVTWDGTNLTLTHGTPSGNTARP